MNISSLNDPEITSAAYPNVRLKGSNLSDHPWVFRQHLEKPESRIFNGQVADLLDIQGNFLARGHYNNHARIGFRILTRNPKTLIDRKFLREHLMNAWLLRSQCNLAPPPPSGESFCGAFRLVHSEADLLSGLIIDIYGQVAMIQWTSAGMFKWRSEIEQALTELFGIKKTYAFAEKNLQKQESFDCREPEKFGAVNIEENGLIFQITPDIHHKTGFYLDQRRQRAKVRRFATGKKVLDLCCFSGGFALNAARGKAASVTAIDLDPEAIQLAKHNASLNREHIEWIVGDAVAWTNDAAVRKESFDMVILDPAKLTKNRDDLPRALKQYVHMNRRALEVIKPGGMLVTCSCTGLVSQSDFLDTLRHAAWLAKRQVQVIEVSGADADHPMLIAAPESRYLKVVWALVT